MNSLAVGHVGWSKTEVALRSLERELAAVGHRGGREDESVGGHGGTLRLAEPARAPSGKVKTVPLDAVVPLKAPALQRVGSGILDLQGAIPSRRRCIRYPAQDPKSHGRLRVHTLPRHKKE